MNGSKGGSRGQGKSYTGKESKRIRWETFRKYRIEHSLHPIGNEKLFRKCWAEEEGIVKLRQTGHHVFSECVKIIVSA